MSILRSRWVYVVALLLSLSAVGEGIAMVRNNGRADGWGDTILCDRIVNCFDHPRALDNTIPMTDRKNAGVAFWASVMLVLVLPTISQFSLGPALWIYDHQTVQFAIP